MTILTIYIISCIVSILVQAAAEFVCGGRKYFSCIFFGMIPILNIIPIFGGILIFLSPAIRESIKNSDYVVDINIRSKKKDGD